MVTLDFIHQYSKYVLACFTMSPLLFLVANEFWVKLQLKKTAFEWRKRERQTTKTWESEEFKDVDRIVRKHLRKQIQRTGVLALVFILNLVAQPFVLLATLGTAPFLLWMMSLLLLAFLSKQRAKKLAENGLHLSGVIHHERLQKLVREVSDYRPYIALPYAFFYHYERLLSIPEQMSEVIRSDKKSHIALAESQVLSDEEEWLMEEAYIAITGRIRNYNQEVESESLEAMRRMMLHAKNPLLSVEFRKKAIRLARKLQYRAEYETLEEARQLDALLDMETVERYDVREN